MATAAVATKNDASISGVRRFYRPELDCLRFFAFLSVYFYHVFPSQSEYYAQRRIPLGTLIASASRAGSFGVDLFFLLSAYLITELLLREKEQMGAVHLKYFYLRRILRIWPLYFFALLVGSLLPLIDSVERFPISYIVAFLLLSGNWMTSLVGFTESVLNPLWSVSFEEQFYLIWPTFIANSRKLRTLLVASGVMALVSAIGRMILLKYARHGDTAIFTNTIARLDPLALGIVTAVMTRERWLVFRWWTRLCYLAMGIAVWLSAGHLYAVNRTFMVIGYPAMALGSWLLFMSVFRIRFAPAWLRYCGKISYGLYVFHMLALYLAEKLIGGYARNWGKFVTFLWLGLGLTFAMAA